MKTPGARGDLLLVVLLVQWSYSAQTLYREGDELNLEPNYSGESDHILWNNNASLVAEWSKAQGTVRYYSTYDGRTTLNTTNGRLHIRNLQETDRGAYTVEINFKVFGPRYTVEVLKAVPQPTVAVKPLVCNRNYKTCTLTCDGNIERCGPVTYSWRRGDGEWTQGDLNLIIINNEETLEVKTFSCRLQNRINTETSEPVKNPFCEKPNNIVATVVVIIVGMSVFGAVGAVAFWKRDYLMTKLRSIFQPENVSNVNGEYHPAPTTNNKDDQ
ncbi:hypothetical protein PAMP_001285 [Pampus punctatissimus]